MAITPADPWFYLIFYGSFMVFILTFGIIVAISQRRKKKAKEQQVEDNNQTPN
ncbi:MAG: hypothetical protein ACTSQK_05370 [Candidatus Heimdallarchaeota archaeon]